MADIYLQQDKMDQAIEAYQQVITTPPLRPGIISKLGQIYKKQDKQAEWLDYLKLYVKTNPTLVSYDQVMAEFKSADKLPDGLAFLESLVPERQKDVNLSIAIASITAELGQKDKAIELYKQMLSSDDSQAIQIHLKLGELYQQMGKTAEAIQEFTVRAALCEKLGRKVEALNQYRQIVKMDPNNKEAEEAAKKLNDELMADHVLPGTQIVPTSPAVPANQLPN
jgi:tetratricopeptide (TPR) repeat protein